MPQIATLIGGAGTGKTTELLRIMEGVIDRLHDPRLVGFVSFTRAARAEAASRAADRFGCKPSELEQDGWFRTLHSVCYKVLCVGKELLTDDAASRKWLQNALQADVTGAPTEATETLDVFEGATSEADRALQLWHAARNRLEPLRNAWERADECDERTPDYQQCVEIIDRYEQAKRLDGRLDFTDLVARFAGKRLTVDGAEPCRPDGEPPELPVWFQDEAQDSTALLDAAFRRLIGSESCQWVYFCADPFQCQPTGTMILTRDGEKRIEDLDPELDWIIAFNRRDGNFYGRGKKLKFQIASRKVIQNELWEIETENGDILRSTGNHKWVCRFHPHKCVAVYLMKKGTRWRVGTVQMFATGKDGNDFRLGMRTQQESAECSWILKVFDTDCEARAYEQIVSCNYGIPQVTFRPPCGCKTNLTQWFIDTVFDAIGDTTVRALACLAAHNRSVRFPFYTSGENVKRSKYVSSLCVAYNLIPGVISIPRFLGREDGRTTRINGIHRAAELRETRKQQVQWVPIKAVRRCFGETQTTVFSLNIEKHHTYVADGYVTGNSIYGWAGADHRLLNTYPSAKQRVMPKSYRCPAPILALGEEVLRECSDYWDRKIAPADHDGTVDAATFGAEIVDEIDPRGSWLLLARTNFQARRLAHLLDEAGVPWLPTRGRGGWNAPVRSEAMRTLLDLQAGAPISGDQWQQVLKHLPAKADGRTLLEHGTKAKWAAMDEEEVQGYAWIMPDELGTLGGTPELAEAIRSGQWQRYVEGAETFAAAIGRWGEEAVAKPGVQVGTVHSVKGAEADNVILLTTISGPCYKAAQSEEGFNEEARVKYVGVTRARRRLIIVDEHRPKYRWKLPV